MSRLIAASAYGRDLIDALVRQGIAVEQFHPEAGAGQLELSVAAESPVEAADTSVLVRSTIRAVGISTVIGPPSRRRWTRQELAAGDTCT